MTDALAELYGSVRQERLRDGLQTLSGDIVMKADMEEALERFQGQFNNRYIDSLAADSPIRNPAPANSRHRVR